MQRPAQRNDMAVAGVREALACTCMKRAAADRIAAQAEADPRLLAELVALVGDDDPTVAWHAAWALDETARRHAELLGHLRAGIERRAMAETRQSVQRLLLSVVCRMETSAEPDVELLDFCLDGIRSPRLGIAARALCVKVACKLCCGHEPLAEELRLRLGHGDGESLPAAVAAARRNALRAIDRYAAAEKMHRERPEKAGNYIF